MYRIVISSHGEFANGLKNTLHYFYNDLSNVDVIILDQDGIESYRKKLDALFLRFEQEEILFFTDLLYGTPFNEISSRAIQSTNIFDIIANVNLPVLLEAVNYQKLGDQLLETMPKLIKLGKVELFSQKIAQQNNLDDE